ncbi:MAG: RNA methyltransferase [Thermoleophilia bacterium]|nr:RNA methyltransferase [Thermoleophilia bacterium]
MITSPDNEKLKLVRKLRLKKHRAKLALFLTEGEDLVRSGFASGLKPRALLTRPGFEPEGPDGGPAEHEEVEPDLLDRVSATGSGTRVIGIWPQRWESAERLSGTCLFLDAVGDPGNMGTIIRTVDALLEATVVVGPDCVDPYAPGSVRASMGSIFGQPLVRATIEQTPEPRIAMVVSGGEAPGPLRAPVTICLGSEREGLSPAVLDHCGLSWTVRQRKQGAESLNVAAAAAIACERISSPMAAGESS